MPQPARCLGIASLLVALALAFGCATPPTISQIEAALMRSANVKRRGPGLRVVPVHAGSPMEAWTLLVEAKTDAESSRSLRLGRSFRGAATHRLTFIIGGPYAGLTDQLIRNGLSQNAGGLPGLTLVVVSPKPPSSSLVEAAREARATLHYRALQ